jgi:hypothetical protein
MPPSTLVLVKKTLLYCFSFLFLEFSRPREHCGRASELKDVEREDVERVEGEKRGGKKMPEVDVRR